MSPRPLPDEIWLEILSHFRRPAPPARSRPKSSTILQPDLAACMRVSALWNTIAAPLLYERVITQRLPLLLAGAHSVSIADADADAHSHRDAPPAHPNVQSKADLLRLIKHLSVELPHSVLRRSSLAHSLYSGSDSDPDARPEPAPEMGIEGRTTATAHRTGSAPDPEPDLGLASPKSPTPPANPNANPDPKHKHKSNRLLQLDSLRYNGLWGPMLYHLTAWNCSAFGTAAAALSHALVQYARPRHFCQTHVYGPLGLSRWRMGEEYYRRPLPLPPSLSATDGVAMAHDSALSTLAGEGAAPTLASETEPAMTRVSVPAAPCPVKADAPSFPTDSTDLSTTHDVIPAAPAGDPGAIYSISPCGPQRDPDSFPAEPIITIHGCVRDHGYLVPPAMSSSVIVINDTVTSAPSSTRGRRVYHSGAWDVEQITVHLNRPIQYDDNGRHVRHDDDDHDYYRGGFVKNGHGQPRVSDERWPCVRDTPTRVELYAKFSAVAADADGARVDRDLGIEEERRLVKEVVQPSYDTGEAHDDDHPFDSKGRGFKRLELRLFPLADAPVCRACAAYD